MKGWFVRGGRRRERPFLILTLRRTGGTALTGALSRASSFPAARHEPFNADREFGDVSLAYRDSGDEVALRTTLADRMGRCPNIKHCVETVPAGVTRGVIETAVARDYALVVLTRRDERQRLRSLAIAQAGGAWGPRQTGPREAAFRSGAQGPTEIDLEALARRAERDAAALGTLLRVLRNGGHSHEWWLYEEIYEGNRSPAVEVAALAWRLGLSCSADDPAFAHLAASRTESAGIEPYLTNLAEAEALLERLVVA